MSRYPELWSIPTSTLLTSKLTPHFTPPLPTQTPDTHHNHLRRLNIVGFISEDYLMVVTAVDSFHLSCRLLSRDLTLFLNRRPQYFVYTKTTVSLFIQNCQQVRANFIQIPFNIQQRWNFILNCIAYLRV